MRDDDGHAFGGELERIGYNGKAPVGGRSIDAYFELHIEQGPILDREAVPVGIVVGGYATRGMHVDVLGETAHAGPTPMDRRQNALVGAAMLAVAVNDIGWKYHATEGKATVARMVAWPNKAGILSEYAPAHLRRAPRRPGGGRSDARGGEGRHPRLRAARQRRDAHRRASGSSATSASTPAASR